MNSDFSRIITLQRKERKISQKQAAADLGISQALLSHYEKGIRECGLDFLVKIADYYNVSCDYLLGRISTPGRSYPDEKILHTDECAEKIQLISESAETVMSISEKSGNHEMLCSISDMIMLTIYKTFRIVYSSDPENDHNFFRVSEDLCENSADCLASGAAATLKKSGREKPSAVKPSLLYDEFPGTASLIKLINLTEEKIINKLPDAKKA
jgi:transcriptional regulator with XRE-family HTH domain